MNWCCQRSQRYHDLFLLVVYLHRPQSYWVYIYVYTCVSRNLIDSLPFWNVRRDCRSTKSLANTDISLRHGIYCWETRCSEAIHFVRGRRPHLQGRWYSSQLPILTSRLLLFLTMLPFQPWTLELSQCWCLSSNLESPRLVLICRFYNE